MRTTLFPVAMLASLLTNLHGNDPVEPSGGEGSTVAKTATPICLTANDLAIATGKPSRVLMSSVSTHIPVWSLSGGTVGQSVSGVVGALPKDWAAVKVEIVVTTNDPETSSEFSDMYRIHLSQMVEGAPFTDRYSMGRPVTTALPEAPLHSRTILLQSYYEVVPNAPLTVRVQREPGLPGDTFTRPTGLAVVKVSPVPPIKKAHVVQDVSGYNSWPMTQAIGDKLVCTYSRGARHTISEDARAVFARTSTDGGKTWTPETVVANTPDYGEVTVGKGLDSTGAMLLWVRRVGKERHHDLYRTTDGENFTLLATPKLAVQPMQITDVFAVPDVGLMALWFAGNYSDKPVHSWGMMTSRDEGATWEQTTIESGLLKADWPTEPAAVYLGDGRIFGIARTETGPTQFQITSTDNGATWTRKRTNIGDIHASTPTLILDSETGLLSNYYYQRGQGKVRRRVVDPETVFDHPDRWPASEVVTTGSRSTWDSGNTNATVNGDMHYVSFYSGKVPDTSVMVLELAEPIVGDERGAQK